jgi:hypothetical protein
MAISDRPLRPPEPPASTAAAAVRHPPGAQEVVGHRGRAAERIACVHLRSHPTPIIHVRTEGCARETRYHVPWVGGCVPPADPVTSVA